METLTDEIKPLKGVPKVPLRKVAENFNAMVDCFDKQDRLVIEYMSHPEASANEIMRMHQHLVKSRAHLKRVRAQIEFLYQNIWDRRVVLKQY